MSMDIQSISGPALPASRVDFLLRFARETVIVGIAYALYYIARHAVDDAAPAFIHADRLVQFESSLGIFKEISLQSATISYDFAVHLFNAIYFYGHWPVIIGAAVYLFWKHPRVYSITRTAFLLSGGVALVLFALYPVAPPRLSVVGVVDTLGQTVPISYDNSPLFNPYAALPSMHVGWDLLVALALFLACKQPLLRVLALLLPPAMLLATVATGNHFFVDGIAGGTLCFVAFIIAAWLHGHAPSLLTRLRASLRRPRPAVA
jgi:hypothetical protein